MNLIDRLLTHQHRTPKIHLTVRPKTGGKVSYISTIISDRLISLTLTNYRGFDADQLDLQLDDSDGQLALPARGALLALGLGWQGEPLTFKGDYTVDEVEHSGSPDTLTIRARSADLRGALLNRFERSFHRTTIEAIVKQIAEENKLKPLVSIALANLEIEHIDQTNESSINLLQRLAEAYDAIATVKNGNLLFMPAGRGKTVNGKEIPVLIITRQQGDSHRFSIAEGDNYEGVKAYWHNTTTGKRGEVIWDKHSQIQKTIKPTMKKVTRVKKDSQGKSIKGKDGKSVKVTTYVKGKGRKVNKVSGTQIKSNSEKIKTLRHTYATEQSATNAVKRHFDKLQRGVATFSLNLAVGDAELIPEMPIQLQGFKTEIDSSDWIISQVTHNVSPDSGFTTQIECELKVEEET